jgi:PqqD family protein of HPr-rel-A system
VARVRLQAILFRSRLPSLEWIVTDIRMSLPCEQFWRITQGCELSWRSWNDEYVVYNSGSGDTHLLDLLSAEILRKIEEAPASARELENWIAGKAAADSPPEISGYVANVLLQLHSLALIEIVGP